MHRTKPLFSRSRSAFVLLLVLLAGCATQTEILDVGEVVVAPQVQLPPPPAVVLQTLPKPAGYFQCSFLSYFGTACEKPTTSTPPTPPAAPTR